MPAPAMATNATELLSKEEYDSSIPLAQIRPHSNPP
jgi:hypothetical protein